MFKALISLEGLGRQYDPEFRLVDRVRPFLDRALSERYQPVMALRRSQATLANAFGLLTTVPRDLARLVKDACPAACGSTSISSDSIASDDRNHDGVARHRFIDRHDRWQRPPPVRRSRANLGWPTWLSYRILEQSLDHRLNLAFGPMMQGYGGASMRQL
jgi:hypothetical protein